MKKVLFVTCTLILSMSLSGCSLSDINIADIRNMILGNQSAPTEPAVRPDVQDETLQEAANQLEGVEAQPEGEPEPEVVAPPEPVLLAELLKENEATLRESVKNRFLRYIAVDTTTNAAGDTVPSTENQLMLAREIAAEMQAIGLDTVVNDYGYVYATLPATAEGQPVIGLIAHLDTSNEVNGAAIRPSVVENYNGGDIILDDAGQVVLSPNRFPQMNELLGDELIVTDGTTLLGGDDKAGVAEIVTLCEYLAANPQIQHGTVKVAFIPDKELGQGADYFDVPYFGANYAYTVDGETLSAGVQIETFNEARGTVTVTGSDGDTTKNASIIAAEFLSMLPIQQDGVRGYYEVSNITGGMQQAVITLCVRDYEREKFDTRKGMLQTIADYLNRCYGEATVQLALTDTGYNMSGIMAEHPEVTERAINAFIAADLSSSTAAELNAAVITPNRFLTDGAELSFMGLPCPNLPTGTANKHSVYECVSVDQMTDMVRMLVHLLSSADEVVYAVPAVAEVSEEAPTEVNAATTESNAAAEVNTETKAEPNAAPKVNTETKAESNAAPKVNTETKAESNAAPKVNTETKAEPNAAAEVNTETKAEPNAAAEVNTETKAEPNAAAEVNAETKAEPNADAEVNAETKAEPNADAEVNAETKAEPNAAASEKATKQ